MWCCEHNLLQWIISSGDNKKWLWRPTGQFPPNWKKEQELLNICISGFII
eukprot:m.332670 g.332670  ORF g.332670 m.332670 type:complete len:50 (-) comp16983_c0_seq1:41-190(-)